MKKIIVFLVIALSATLHANPVETDVEIPSLSVESSVSVPISDAELQSMDFKGLIECASQNLAYRSSIVSIMTSKFQIDSKKIGIESARYTTSLEYKIEKDEIVFMNLDLASKFIRIFGELLKNIEFRRFKCQGDNCLEMMILINEYCPNLIDSKLMTKYNSLLPKPFEKVRKFFFIGGIDEDLLLHKIYPNMEELKLGGMAIDEDDTDFIRNYPSLKKLTYNYMPTESYIEDLVKENPQVVSIEASQIYPSFEFFQKISTQMPNIKTLKFATDKAILGQQTLGPIYFDNIENLIVENWFEADLINLPFVFNQLKSFTFYQYGHYAKVMQSKDWLKSIPHVQKLKEFSMPVTEFSTQNLIEYSEIFPELESLTIYGMDKYDDAFNKFLTDTKIQSITIKSILNSRTDRITGSNLSAKFDMNVSDVGEYGCTLSLKLRSV